MAEAADSQSVALFDSFSPILFQMFLNWTAILAGIVTLGVFFLVHRIAGRQRWWWGLAACLLAIPGVTFTTYYLHWLPEPEWYFEFRSWPGSEWWIIPVGLAGGGIAALLPRWLRVLPLTATVVFAIS
ncbi:MAG: hypothetical protein KDM63_22680, partial [Verrucomicrobiae bacterium]|nr:hypothetical protein [Verrucomicrobiae bacterium]